MNFYERNKIEKLNYALLQNCEVTDYDITVFDNDYTIYKFYLFLDESKELTYSIKLCQRQIKMVEDFTKCAGEWLTYKMLFGYVMTVI